GESNGKEIYSSEKIGDFIFTKNKLITIEETGERTYLYDATNHKQLAIPTGDPVALDGSNDSNIIVINTLDRSTFRRALFVYTLSDGRFKELMGNGNAPVDSSFSLLAPDGKTVIYQLSADGSTYVDDPFDDRDALNIGTINRVIGFLPAGNGLFIEKTFNTFGVLNPETGKFTETKQPLHVGSVIGLSKNSQVYIEYLFGNDPDGQNIILTRDNTTQTIYQNNGDTGQITDIRASTSREFIEIEFSPQPPIYDSYKTFSKPKDGAIILIDQQGNTIDQITASLIRWL
ncbi:hypothetical protein KC992_01540, partial [Candidatus Saccharibacteria bacterium]|nr:hypothetical protein [Candidatus Saccharibacteria bacterium]